MSVRGKGPTTTPDDDLGPAALLRDFVNTAEPQTGGESLSDPEALLAWCTARGLLAPDTRLTADDVTTAVAVREGLRGVLQSHAGHAPPSGPRADLQPVLHAVPLRAAFDESGDLRLGPATDGPAARLVAGLLDAVRQATADGTWHRLKVCARDSCRWAFYDESRNRSGRWCSMAGCGNIVKMQRAHARRRQSPSTTG
jgi:predicted RNA-binding Zn ribbon-like protein